MVTSQYINPVNNNGNRHGTIPFITSAITTLVSPFVYFNGIFTVTIVAIIEPIDISPNIDAAYVSFSISPPAAIFDKNPAPNLYPPIIHMYLRITCGILNNRKNKIGPRIFPFIASDVPIPVAIIRSVPHIKESPIPASGPINPAFTLLMDDVSKFSSSAFSSSIAVLIPRINVTICGVVLKNSKCLCNAAAFSSGLSLYSFSIIGIIAYV